MPLSAQRRDEGFCDIGGAVTEWLHCHLGLSILAVMSSGGHNVCFALCTDDLDKIRQFVGAYDYDQICVGPPPSTATAYVFLSKYSHESQLPQNLADEIPRAPFSFASGKYGRLVDPSPAPHPIAVLASLDRELRQHIDIPFFNSALPPTPAPVPEPVPPALVPPAPVPTPAVEPTNLPAQEQVDSERHDLPNRHWVFRLNWTLVTKREDDEKITHVIIDRPIPAVSVPSTTPEKLRRTRKGHLLRVHTPRVKPCLHTLVLLGEVHAYTPETGDLDSTELEGRTNTLKRFNAGDIREF
ncbi:hypothetical protein BS47DRAFT_1402629 [Hydnum rufescens UP504]|uniref:Uncharacterized protein n=1 Tax=Hydnum rufescens UP504 TaxID=1448309 RepID=A0A9P6AC13_9AGAM|nr:hypothetical protein BS47DRAFT_1402629 [Hydnum rufescens UP504]